MNEFKNWDDLTITDDFMFCKVMQNEKICRQLLELILHVKVGKIKFLTSQHEIEIDPQSKAIAMDVYLRDEDKIINVEMQNGRRLELPKRTRYYQAVADVDNTSPGKLYTDMKDNYVIFICTFAPFYKGLPQYTFSNSCDELPDLKLNDKCRKIAYNVGAFEKVNDEKIRKLLEFISTGKSETSLTDKIRKELHRVHGNEEWRAEYMTLQMLKQETYNIGFIDGEKRGITQGAYQKAIETAKKLIDLGLPQNQITSVTGLSIEEIEKL